MNERIVSGSRGVVCNVEVSGSDAATDDPVSQARAATAAAQQQQMETEREAEAAQAKDQAKAATGEAQSRSEAAYKAKPGTPKAAKAHQAAAMAHTDAKTAWAGQAGAKSGNDLDTRAKAQRQADAHGQQADAHKSMGKAGGSLKDRSTLNTGSRGVTVNMWSDAAREASVEARAASGKVDAAAEQRSVHRSKVGFEKPEPYNEMASHRETMEKLHREAAASHHAAAALYPKGSAPANSHLGSANLHARQSAMFGPLHPDMIEMYKGVSKRTTGR